MQKYTFKEHFIELKNRLFKMVIFFILSFSVCYFFKEYIYDFFLEPLSELNKDGQRRIIYTGLAEAFFSYIKLSIFSAFCLTIPIICYQLYAFIAPGLKPPERKIIAGVFALSPFLFYIGSFFVFYFVMPRAWDFFLSYEGGDTVLPLVMEARISEYLSFVMQLTWAFGIAFQLPIVMIILTVIGLINANTLKKKRRVSVVIIFIIAAIFTPPDVISQIALAIPLLLLYELSIILCNLVEKRRS